MSYVMRALGDPGPGYVFWKVGVPDYAGTYAPSAIQAGTAVVVSGEVPLRGLGKLDNTHSPVGLWLFDGDLTDSSGNGFDLTGSVFGYTDFGAILNGTELTYSTVPNALQIAGPLTVEIIGTFVIGAGQILVSMSGTGESLATNCLYQWGWGTAGTHSIYWEYGSAATNVTWTGTGVSTYGYPCHLAMTRTDSEPTTVTIYCDGVAIGDTGSVHTAEGGTSGILRAFAANDGTADLYKGTQVSCLKILNTCLTAAQIKAEYNRTLGGRGVAYPVLS